MCPSFVDLADTDGKSGAAEDSNPPISWPPATLYGFDGGQLTDDVLRIGNFGPSSPSDLTDDSNMG
jgi:hypothetical protein